MCPFEAICGASKRAVSPHASCAFLLDAVIEELSGVRITDSSYQAVFLGIRFYHGFTFMLTLRPCSRGLAI